MGRIVNLPEASDLTDKLWRKFNELVSMRDPLLQLSVGLASACGVIEVVSLMQRLWSGSPLFWFIGLTSSLLLGLLGIGLSLIAYLVTGKSSIFANIYGLIGNRDWMFVLCSFFFAVVGSSFITRLVLGLATTKKIRAIVIMCSLSILPLFFLFGTMGGFGDWLEKLIVSSRNIFWGCVK